MKEEDKTAGQKMRDFYWEHRKKSKASKELKDALRKKEQKKDKPEIKMARPFTPEAGA